MSVALATMVGRGDWIQLLGESETCSADGEGCAVGDDMVWAAGDGGDGGGGGSVKMKAGEEEGGERAGGNDARATRVRAIAGKFRVVSVLALVVLITSSICGTSFEYH